MRKAIIYIISNVILASLVATKTYSQPSTSNTSFFNNQPFSNNNINNNPSAPSIIIDPGGGSDDAPFDNGVVCLAVVSVLFYARQSAKNQPEVIKN